MPSTTPRILIAILRATIPLIVLAGGLGSLLYGVGRHSASVSVEQEIEINLAAPAGVVPPVLEGDVLPDMGPPGDPIGPLDPGFGGPALAGPPPWLAPPPELSKVKQKVIFTEDTSELTLIREVTFGGVTRLSSGVLWRTYTGAPPSLCPT